MGIPLPALQLRSQQENPLETYGRALSLKSLLQQQELQKQQMQQYQLTNKQRQQQIQEQEAIRQALAEAGGDVRKAMPKILQVAPITGMKFKQSVDEWDAADNTARKAILDRHLTQIKGLGQLAGSITDQPSYEAAIKQAKQAGFLEDADAAQLLATPYNPQVVEGFKQQALTVQEGIENKEKELAATETIRHNKAMEAKENETTDVKNYRYAVVQGYKGTFEQWQKDEATRRPVPQQTVTVQTVDENGNPITKIVPKVAGAEYAAKPTSTTLTMRETAPKIKDFITRIRPLVGQQQQQLGPLAGRWSELMTGAIGAPNPQFAKLRTDIGLLQTLLMRMHVGARGGQQLMGHFKSLIDSGKQSPENLLASLDEIEAYANDIASEGISGPSRPAQAGGDFFSNFGGKKH